MRIDVYHHFGIDEKTVLKKLDEILIRLGRIEGKEVTLMATLATFEDVLKDITEETTQIDGLSTLIASFKQQLAEVLSGTVIPPAVQAKVDAIFNQAEINKAKLAEALNANVTPAPPAPAA